MGNRRVLLQALSAALLVCACSGDSAVTQLVVVVNTDYEPVTEVAFVVAEVHGSDDPGTERWPVVREQPESGQVTFPFSFGISPPDGDAHATVDLVLTAQDRERETLVRRRVRVGFVGGQTRLLRIDLTHACGELYLQCEAMGSPAEPRTCIADGCGDDGCEDVAIDAADLPRVAPRDELSGVDPLPEWVDDCGGRPMDAGPDAMLPLDSGMHDAGEDAAAGAGGAGGAGGAAGDGGSSSVAPDADTEADAEVDAGDDAGDGDAGPLPPIDCGRQIGFFADVGRTLTKTTEGISCPVLAQSYILDGATPAENAMRALDRIDDAAYAGFDIFELKVLQAASEPGSSDLYVTDEGPRTDNLPTLASVLDDPELRTTAQPLKLTLTDHVIDPATLADALLALLAGSGAPYVQPCRPIYLVGEGDFGLESVITTRALLAADTRFAALRGLLHFGARIDDGPSPSAARDLITAHAEQGLDLVELDMKRADLLLLARQARAAGLAVFAKGAYLVGLSATLCGLVDVLETNSHATMGRSNPYRLWIQHSQRLIDLDVSAESANASMIDYFGSDQPRVLDSSTPSLMRSGPLADLPDGYLHFDATAGQSLALHDAEPAGGDKLAGLALLRLGTNSLPPGSRQVIVGKQGPDSGFSLELVNDANVTELRFQVFTRGETGEPALTVTSWNASSLSPDVSYAVVFGTGVFPFLWIEGQDVTNGDFIANRLYEPNSEPVTLGAQPDGTDNFTGDLQLLRLIAYDAVPPP